MRILEIFPGYVNFDWFTPNANEMLGMAAAIAVEGGHLVVNPEHLFVAAFESSRAGSSAIRKVYPEQIEALFKEIRRSREFIIPGAVPPETGSSAQIKIPPFTRELLRHAIRTARKLKHQGLDPDHVLLALFGHSRGRLASLINAAQIDWRKCCIAVEESLQEVRDRQTENSEQNG